MGKGTNRTAIKKADFLVAFKAKAGNISHACDASQVGRQTYYGWLEADAAFAQAVEDINESLIDWGEGLLKVQMQKGDTTAIIFFLKTKGKKRGYVERQEMEHSGAVDNHLIVEFVETKG